MWEFLHISMETRVGGDGLLGVPCFYKYLGFIGQLFRNFNFAIVSDTSR
jgi:hypothetical protein